jgi:hypothetical protein
MMTDMYLSNTNSVNAKCVQHWQHRITKPLTDRIQQAEVPTLDQALPCQHRGSDGGMCSVPTLVTSAYMDKQAESSIVLGISVFPEPEYVDRGSLPPYSNSMSG